MRRLVFLSSIALLTACMDCSQADCAAQLEIDVALDRAGPVELEVCRGVTCFGPASVDADGLAVLASTDELGLEASRFDDSVRGGVLRISASSRLRDGVDQVAPEDGVEWTVRVRDGMDLLLDEQVPVSYEPAFPNGEGCGPTCYEARLSFAAAP